MKKRADLIFLLVISTLPLFPGISLFERAAAQNLPQDTMREAPFLAGFDIRDIKGPVLPENFSFEIITGLLAAGTLSLFAAYRVRKKRRTLLPRLRPPQESAYEALDRLPKNLSETGMILEYYSGLADILRKYLRDRFDLNALKMTADEVIRALRGLSGFSPQDMNSIEELLRESDAAKFARYFPPLEEIAARTELCREMIARTAEERVP